MEAATDRGKESAVSQNDPRRIDVLFIYDEWNSCKGGLSTFNTGRPNIIFEYYEKWRFKI